MSLLLTLTLLLVICHLEVRYGARNALRVLIDVEAFIDRLWDRLDFRTEISLDIVQVESVIPVNQVDCQTKMAIPTRSTNTMEICLGVLGEVKVDDNVDRLDVDATGEEIGAYQVAAYTITEIVEDAIPGLLGHLSVTVEARVAQFGDLLGEQLDTVGRVAEDDGLVDLEFAEQSVQAVDLLLFFHESIVLGDTAQSKFIHEVDFVWAHHVLIREVLDGKGECG